MYISHWVLAGESSSVPFTMSWSASKSKEITFILSFPVILSVKFQKNNSESQGQKIFKHENQLIVKKISNTVRNLAEFDRENNSDSTRFHFLSSAYSVISGYILLTNSTFRKCSEVRRFATSLLRTVTHFADDLDWS